MISNKSENHTEGDPRSSAVSKLRINWVEARANLSGGQKSNLLIAEAMARRGHEVCLSYVDFHPWPPLGRPRRVALRAFQELRILGKPRHHFYSELVHLNPIRRSQILYGDVPDADVSIGSWWETMEWVASWPVSKGLKAYFVRNYEPEGDGQRRARATYELPCLKLVTSRWLGRILKDEFGASDTVLVPNGVDRIQFESAARAKAPAPTVGFMNSGKRFKASHVAIEALRLVQRAEPDLRIVSFGSSPLPRHHGLAHVTYALRPRKERIADIYRSADCWIISSESEGFGMPGLEAAACRCPVVSTRCGGPEDYVLDGKSGHLVEVGDPQGLAERVLDVLRLEPDAWRRMSEASYGMARRFDWDRSAEMLEKALIERLT